jgi:nitroreductase
MTKTTNQPNTRKPEFPVSDIFIDRWSPRAMSGEEITKEEIMPLFEAAKWAPSSYNNQPWRFIYALKNSPRWNDFYDLLGDFNKQWTKNSGALVIVLSKKNFEHNGEYSITHAFDTGAAWENLALQTSISGLVAHGMQGFDYERAKEVLGLNDEYEVHMMVAIGKPGDKESLPEGMQKQESPNSRKSVNEIAFEGNLKE